MADVEAPRTMLPLGRFRAPREGWFIIRGRRGHYSFCDELRAYELATGAAYVVRSCGGLVLRDEGSIDGGKTDAARRARDEVGRVSVDALREAVWMSLLASEVQHDVVEAGFGWHVPDSIEIARSGGYGSGVGMGSFRSTSAQTSLAWTWVVNGGVVKRGELTWPQDYNHAAREHAVQLLAIAEATLTPGCPPAALPSPLVVGSRGLGGVSGIDADAASLSKAQAGLEARLAGLVGTKTCAGARDAAR